MAGSGVPPPLLPMAPREYDQQQLNTLIASLSAYFSQASNPGPGRFTEIVLTALPEYADNAAAVAGGLGVGGVYKTAAGALRIVV